METERTDEASSTDSSEPVKPADFGDQLDTPVLETEDLSEDQPQYLDMLQRVQADFVNYKRRANEEREEQQKYANSRLVLRILPVLDEFSLAMQHASESDAGASWLEGIKLIQRKMLSVLESENVQKIDADGKEFQPFEHEAVGYQESNEHQDGQILTVVRDGYKMHDRIIRPALVILSKKPSPAEGKETKDA